MPQLTADDITRLTTKADGLKARIAEIRDSPVISPEDKKRMIAVREKQVAEIVNILGGAK